jgi:hypothetical protein
MEFTALICVYERDNIVYFEEACDSMFDQTLFPNEIVFVVDGPVSIQLKNSILGIERKIQEKDCKCKIVWLKQNMGHGIARQSGLEQCTYGLVALVDADDINYVDRFKSQVDHFKFNPHTSVLGSQIREISHSSKRPLRLKTVPCGAEALSTYLKTRCPFNQMSVMFKKQDVLNSGGYIDFFHNEDYYLWIRMSINGYIFANLPTITVDARVNEFFYDRRGGLKYFLSEVKIQRYMLKNGVISLGLYALNIGIRFLVQMVTPPRIRGKIFQLFFRKKL